MSKSVRWVFAIAVCFVALVGLAIGATVGSVVQAGSVTVSVTERGGGSWNVTLPAGIANAALAAVEWVPADSWEMDRDTREIVRRIERHWPVVQNMLDRLSEQGDFTLVEVDSEDEHVLIRKVGRELVVFVEDSSERIEVTLPLTTVRAFARRVGRIAERFDD